MKRIYILLLIISLVGTIVLISCKKELSCESCADNNRPPISNAGPDQTTVLPKDSVLLDGSASTDAEGAIKSYKWIKITGPLTSVITKSDASKTSVTSLLMGVYQFELTVTDNGGLSAKDTVQIIVVNPAVNQPPIANAGADQTIALPLFSVALNGSGSADPDNNITGYAWTKISGPSTSNISNANAVQTQVTSLVQGVYQFELKVTDAGSLFSKDTVQVTVNGTVATVQCAGNRPEINARLVPFGTLSKARSGMAVASAGGKILFAGGTSDATQSEIGGSSRVDVYNINTNTWTAAELSVPRFNITAVANGNKIFFAGGQSVEIGNTTDTYYSTVDIYDASTNTWTVTSLSEDVVDIAAAAVGNKVIFAGGYGTNKIGNITYSGYVSNKIDIYDIATNTWTSAIMSESKSGISAVTCSNKVYLAGGSGKLNNTTSNKIDIYDNASGAWTTATLSEPKTGMAAISVGNKIYWAGGFNGQQVTCKVEVRDVNTQTTTIDYLSYPYSPITAVLKDNKIVTFSWIDKFDIYDLNTNTWSFGRLPTVTPGASIISVNNTIYIAGGVNDPNAVSYYSNQVWKLEF